MVPDSFLNMDYRRVMIMERKPTPSGESKKIVGGEVFPASFLELTFANVLWILLLVVPIALVYVFARRGRSLPPSVGTLLRLVPVAARVFI